MKTTMKHQECGNAGYHGIKWGRKVKQKQCEIALNILLHGSIIIQSRASVIILKLDCNISFTKKRRKVLQCDKLKICE